MHCSLLVSPFSLGSLQPPTHPPHLGPLCIFSFLLLSPQCSPFFAVPGEWLTFIGTMKGQKAAAAASRALRFCRRGPHWALHQAPLSDVCGGCLPGDEGALEGLSAQLLLACEEGPPGGQWGTVMLGGGSRGASCSLPAPPRAPAAHEKAKAGRPQLGKPQCLLPSPPPSAALATPNPLQSWPQGLCACRPFASFSPFHSL